MDAFKHEDPKSNEEERDAAASGNGRGYYSRQLVGKSKRLPPDCGLSDNERDLWVHLELAYRRTRNNDTLRPQMSGSNSAPDEAPFGD